MGGAHGPKATPYMQKVLNIRQQPKPAPVVVGKTPVGASNNWYGHGSKAAWQAAHNKIYGKKAAAGGGCPTGNCGGSNPTQNKKYRYNSDWNSNLREATFKGNRDNQAAVKGFESLGRNLTNDFLSKSSSMTKDTMGEYNDVYKNYDSTIRGHLANLGTADQDIWSRQKAAAFAGLDSGFSDANDQLQASLARRGLSNAGIGVKAMGDLGQARMAAGAAANVNAHNTAIDRSDARRGQRMQGETQLYGTNINRIGQNYTLGMGDLTQKYGTKMNLEGQLLQNRINQNQQRIANLMGYAQLGRGMAGMSQNYLAQAGSGFGQIGQISGSTALGIGGLNNSYNQTMQAANSQYNNTLANIYGTQQRAATAADAQKSEAKGAGLSTAGTLGAAAIGAMVPSDIRLKDDLKMLGEINGIDVYTWTWNDKAKEIGADVLPAFGVIAQDVMLKHPDVVKRDKDTGYWKVDYSKLFGGA